MNYIKLLIVLILVATTNGLMGRQVSCRFLCFLGDSVKVMAATGPDSFASVEIGNEIISDPILCHSNENRLVFKDPGNEGLIIGSATISDASETFILVFVPKEITDSADILPWRILVIDDSVEKFPSGGVVVGNFQPQNIRFVLGEQKNLLRSGALHAYPMPLKRDRFNMAAAIFEFNKDDKWLMARETKMRFIPGLRYLIFGYLDPRSGRPRLATFEDSL